MQPSKHSDDEKEALLARGRKLVQKVRAAKPDFLFLLPTAVSDDKLLLEKLSEMGLNRGRLPVEPGIGPPL